MKKTLSVLLLFLTTFATASAQQTTDEMIKNWERGKAYTREYLDAMPDDGYSLKPTPEMRSFAEQMLHLAEANYMFAAGATGEKSPVTDLEKSTTDKSKANITKITLDSYDYVIASIKKLSAAQFKEMIKFFGQFDMTKEEVFNKAFEHQTHHRGQTTVYLRLKGVKPPQEKLF